MVNALTELKIIVSTGDDLSLRRAISYFLNNIAKQTQEQETIAAIGEDMFAVALDQPFRCNILSFCPCTMHLLQSQTIATILLWLSCNLPLSLLDHACLSNGSTGWVSFLHLIRHLEKCSFRS